MSFAAVRLSISSSRMNILTFLSLTLVGHFVSVNCDSDNPCDGGELFNLVCQMLRVMKKNVARGNRELETRFNTLTGLQKNATEELKAEIAKESKRLSQKQASDVKMLVGMIEEKIKGASSILQVKMEKNQKAANDKIDTLRAMNEKDILALETEVNEKMSNNTSAYKQTVQKLETEIEADKKRTNK